MVVIWRVDEDDAENDEQRIVAVRKLESDLGLKDVLYLASLASLLCVLPISPVMADGAFTCIVLCSIALHTKGLSASVSGMFATGAMEMYKSRSEVCLEDRLPFWQALPRQLAKLRILCWRLSSSRRSLMNLRSRHVTRLRKSSL